VQAALPGIDRRQWPADQPGMPITQVAALRAALGAGSDALREAAGHFAFAYAAKAVPASGAMPHPANPGSPRRSPHSELRT
jgi:hypothetical protein